MTVVIDVTLVVLAVLWLATPASNRPLTKALISERDRRYTGFCVYCGRPCFGRTCSFHRDLPQREQELMNPAKEV